MPNSINSVVVNSNNPYLTANSETNAVLYKAGKIKPDEYFRREKRQNTGLIEKLYNKIKNATGLGVGTKKVEQVIASANKGKSSTQDVDNVIHKYNTSQENSAQLFGDIASIGVGGGIFFYLRKKLQTLSSIIRVNKTPQNLGTVLGLPSDVSQKIIKLGKSNKKLLSASVILAALAAGWTKATVLGINRIGSKEYKVDEKIYGRKNSRNNLQRILAKQEKKDLRKQRFKSDFKNFASGTINGLMLPVISLGGIIGAPIFLAGNSLNRYFVASKTDENKSLTGYVNNLKNDALLTGAVTVAGAIPLVKKGNFIKVADVNLEKAVKKLENADLKTPSYKGKPALQEIQDLLFKDRKISNIISDEKISIDEQIKKLTDENIFAVKFKQISNDGTELTRALRENCPPTRTLDEAQVYIKNALGDKYEVTKLLGVGTVAETYLAKSKDGQEVCIKIIKQGIDKDKILKDKEKFKDTIKACNSSDDKKSYLLRNIDDLAEGVLKEIDLQNELEAAKKLVPHTKVANVVKPIEVKNGAYVMEKANGISLSSLVELNVAKIYKEALQKNSEMQDLLKPPRESKLAELLKDKKTLKEKTQALDNYIKQIEARTPEFGDISLSKDDAKNLIDEYMKVLTEQFIKIEKGGKALHADIHPGNIFIDINALKKKNNNKIYTLIDTGNVIEQSMEQALRAVNLTSYLKLGNVKDITDYVLEGAVMPAGMTREEGAKKVAEELKKAFFDTETKLDRITNDSILNLSENIMRKYNILPGDVQLNLNKAKQSADNSLVQLIYSMIMLKLKDANLNNPFAIPKVMGGLVKDAVLMQRRYNVVQAKQEKMNLKLLSPKEKLKQLHNPNNLKTNSEDYFTYKLKQNMILDKDLRETF